MTTRAPFLQSSVTRAVKAAHKAGLRVVAIRPDGTVITEDALAVRLDDGQATAPSKWEDVEA